MDGLSMNCETDHATDESPWRSSQRERYDNERLSFQDSVEICLLKMKSVDHTVFDVIFTLQFLQLIICLGLCENAFNNFIQHSLIQND